MEKKQQDGEIWSYHKEYDYYSQNIIFRILFWICFPVTPRDMKLNVCGYYLQ